MDWEKAKNIIIVFFIMLNAMLAVLLYQNNQKYVLSAEAEKTIVNVLAENNISLYAKPISKYEPMKSLNLSYKDIDEKQIIKIFFGTNDAVLTESNDEGIRAYEHNGMNLLFYENRVSFESNVRGEYSELNFDDARKTCDSFISGMGNLGRGFEVDINPYIRDGEIIIEYRQKTNKTVIYNNYILFAIDNYGLRRVEYSAGLPVSLGDDKLDICSSDEALFSFLQAMKRESTERPRRIIEKMDIAYILNTANGESGECLPYYRIYYSEGDDPNNFIHLCVVNAYDNSWQLM